MDQINRRSFLKASAATLAAPYVIPSRCFGANERVTVGCIGVRNQGTGNLKRFLGADCNVAAICDVDSKVAADALKIVTDKGGKAEVYDDYRHLLERKDLDAVVVTVPDHWHALITIHACQAGKDVYCEKPLSLTIREGRRMVEAARSNKRVVQTGSQQRSSKEFWQACSLVRNGKLGKIEKILVGIPGCNDPGPLGPNSKPPANLDYNMWLGPAPERAYNEKRVHYNFRFWWDYSGGQITNFGAHHLDIVQWALGKDDSGPVAVDGKATFNADHIFEVTETCRLTYKYEDGTPVTLGQLQKDIPSGITFVGSEGTMYVNRGKLKSDPEEIIQQPIEELAIQLPRSKNHVGNFLDAMRSREKPICDVEIGHRSATVCHLGNICARLGHGIKWDPENESMIGDSAAQKMTDRPYREPWSHDMRFARTS